MYWKEGFFSANKDIENQLQVSLHASKIDISEELRNNLYEKNSNIILTSATIKVEESFGYFLQRNGLTENDNIITRDYVSPFSYQDQVKYFQYGGSKDITGNLNNDTPSRAIYRQYANLLLAPNDKKFTIKGAVEELKNRSTNTLPEKTLSNTQVSALNEIKNELKNILNILNRH